MTERKLIVVAVGGLLRVHVVRGRVELLRSVAGLLTKSDVSTQLSGLSGLVTAESTCSVSYNFTYVRDLFFGYLAMFYHLHTLYNTEY
jgi:hypothetical protein